MTHSVIPVIGCREPLPHAVIPVSPQRTYLLPRHSQHFLLGIHLGFFRIVAFGQMRKIDWYWEGVYGGYPAMKSM